MFFYRKTFIVMVIKFQGVYYYSYGLTFKKMWKKKKKKRKKRKSESQALEHWSLSVQKRWISSSYREEHSESEMPSGQSSRLHIQWQQLLSCCRSGPPSCDLPQGHPHNSARLKMTCNKAIWICKTVICTQKKGRFRTVKTIVHQQMHK